jgi:alpha-L-rhamnosidase
MTSLTLTVTPPRIEQRVRTLGVGTSTPRVSWSVDGASPGWAQTSYEVECIAASVLIEVVPGSPLEPHHPPRRSTVTKLALSIA